MSTGVLCRKASSSICLMRKSAVAEVDLACLRRSGTPLGYCAHQTAQGAQGPAEGLRGVLAYLCNSTPTRGMWLPCCARARQRPSRRAAEQGYQLAPSYVGHGLLPGTRCAAYRRLRMPRKRPQVLGADLNRSESSQKAGPCITLPRRPCFRLIRSLRAKNRTNWLGVPR
jgi:hypothetical protein